MRLTEFFLTHLSNLNHLIDALVNCVQFDYNNLNNFYEVSSGDAASMSNYSGLETYLHDRRLFEQLRTICTYLGCSDAARLVVDQLLNGDIAHIDHRRYKLEALFLIDLILLGIVKIDELVIHIFSSQYEETNGCFLSFPLNCSLSSQYEEQLSIVNMVLISQLNDLKQYTRVESSELIETLDLDESKTMSRNRTILQIALTLEVIATTSRFLLPKQQSSLLFLVDNLYFTLENYLSPNLLIRCVASRCLNELAGHLGYQSPAALLSDHYDFIMNNLVLKSSELNRRAMPVRK